MNKWPSLSFPPINLWNVPYMFKKKTIIDNILDAELCYYIKMNKHAKLVYLGRNQLRQIYDCLGISRAHVNGLYIISVNEEDYLRVG